MEKELIKIQFGYFFKSEFSGDYELISLKLKELIEDGEKKAKIQIIPIPSDAPSEFPRLTIYFDNYSINVSKNRLDIYHRDIDSLKNLISKVNECLKSFNIEINRIGFVKSVFINSLGMTELKKVLSNKLEPNSFRELNLRIQRHSKILDRDCNNIEDIGHGAYVTKEKNKETARIGLILMRDINIQQQVVDLKFEDIVNLYDAFVSETEKSLLLDTICEK